MFWFKKKSKAQQTAAALWSKLSSGETSNTAQSWFSEFEFQSLESSATDAQLAVHHDFKALFDRGSDLAVCKDMQINLNELEAVELVDSEIGTELAAVLTRLGVRYSEMPLGHDDLEYAPSGIYMRWEDTNSGNLNIQNCSIFRDSSGKELVFWHVNLLASNRPIDYRYIAESRGGNPFADGLGERFVSPEGDYNLNWVIPSLMKDVAYLAEAAHSNGTDQGRSTRDQAFAGVSQKARPIPTFSIQSYSSFNFGHAGWPMSPIIPPHSVAFGWLLTKESLGELEGIIPIVSAGCTLALNIFEEGEEHHPTEWGSVLRHPAVLAQGKPEIYGHRFAAQWMTTPEYSRRHAYVVSSYDEIYNMDRGAERVEGFEDLITNGADRYVPHAANSLVFGEYLHSVQRDELALETALEILAMAFHMDSEDNFGDSQATNAFSNSGVLYYQAGKLDLAERTLLDALDRASGDLEGGSEAEASFVLSLIYRELGDTDRAEEYAQMCEEFGGYGSAGKLRQPGAA